MFMGIGVGKESVATEFHLTMTRSRRTTIDPMVPELPAATYAADGGESVDTTADPRTDGDTEAPMVPDLS